MVSNGRGGDQSEKSSLRSYASQASETLGVTKRTVEKDLARGKKISPDVLAEVAGAELDKGVVLDELARTPAEAQRAAASATSLTLIILIIPHRRGLRRTSRQILIAR